jgi:hypothetical protein
MACFLVPVGEAIITTVAQKVAEKREKKEDTEKNEGRSESKRLTWSRRLSWLNKMLWGGSLLLALEHVWHGEVVPWPPFLTAIEHPGEIAPMLHEMATVGVVMAAAVTAVWGIMVLVAELKTRAISRIKAAPAGGGG